MAVFFWGGDGNATICFALQLTENAGNASIQVSAPQGGHWRPNAHYAIVLLTALTLISHCRSHNSHLLLIIYGHWSVAMDTSC